MFMVFVARSCPTLVTPWTVPCQAPQIFIWPGTMFDPGNDTIQNLLTTCYVPDVVLSVLHLVIHVTK